MKSGAVIAIIGCNHHSVALTEREHLTLGAGQAAQLRQLLKERQIAREAVVLHTCNRVELILLQNPGTTDRVWECLGEASGVPAGEWLRPGFELRNEEALRHLFEVAAGLDAQMVGETEILGQVKDAYAEAVSAESVGVILHRVFQKTFQAAKTVRHQTGVGAGQISIANVAVDLAGRIFGDLRSTRMLIAGIGEAGTATVKAFRSRGTKEVWITNRTSAVAGELAAQVGGQAFPWDQWKTRLREADMIVCSTASPAAILFREEVQSAMAGRPNRPLFLIDMAVPRDIEPSCGELENVFLYNLDDLSAIANENLRQRLAEVETARALLAERARRLWADLCERAG